MRRIEVSSPRSLSKYTARGGDSTRHEATARNKALAADAAGGAVTASRQVSFFGSLPFLRSHFFFMIFRYDDAKKSVCLPPPFSGACPG